MGDKIAAWRETLEQCVNDCCLVLTYACLYITFIVVMMGVTCIIIMTQIIIDIMVLVFGGYILIYNIDYTCC